MARKPAGSAAKAASGAPADPLSAAIEQLVSTIAGRAASSLNDRLSAMTQRLADYADSGGKTGSLAGALTGVSKLAEGRSPTSAVLSTGLSRVKDKVKGAFGGGGNVKPKVTNIVESIDVGVPVGLAYAQWTRFTDFPRYMKKVESVEQVADEKLKWRAQILWSHRTWEATIQEQVPDERIVWRSEGEKGHVDGAVTFHELAPNLTRIVLVLEYYPQGLFEHTGNIWRAQGRRARLELKHFARHAMTNSVLHPDEVEGWLGEIRDGDVVDDGSGADTDEDEEPQVEEPEDEEPEDEEPEERPRRRGRAAGSGSRGPAARSRTAGTGRRTGRRT
jgi:uncharacterized membrane protein